MKHRFLGRPTPGGWAAIAACVLIAAVWCLDMLICWPWDLSRANHPWRSLFGQLEQITAFPLAYVVRLWFPWYSAWYAVAYAAALALNGVLWGYAGTFVAREVGREFKSWRRERRQIRRLCPACGYDLRGTPASECPECGAASGKREADA